MLGKSMGRSLLNRGVIFVGAVDAAPAVIGRDLGEVLELPSRLDVTVLAPDDPTLSAVSADIAVMAAANDFATMLPAYERCVESGMNVLDIGGGVSWAWGAHPQAAARLDRLARTHGVTVTGSGNQELTMGGGTLIASACHTCSSIWHKTRADIERFGLVVLRYGHVGEPADQFKDTMFENTSRDFGSVDVFMANLAADLELTISSIARETRPVTSPLPRWSRVLDRELKPGEIVGTHRIASITTHQGITLVGEEDTSVLADENDVEFKEWVVDGDPPIRMRCELDTRSTASSAVNRVPDVIAAEPGYRTIDTLGRNRFRPHPYLIAR
jgi:4-hydroxy-tetrahydrodipicolinate reductase